MRQLTSRQKKYLEKVRSNRTVVGVDDLLSGELEDLRFMNDTEILYQEVERYLHDKYWEDMS